MSAALGARPARTAAREPRLRPPRQVALSFKPEGTWTLPEGVLQVMTPTPLGERLETFPLDAAQTDEIDGKKWSKTHRWEGTKLISTAVDPEGKKGDFVTERWIDDEGHLNQVNSHDGVAFTRIFHRAT